MKFARNSVIVGGVAVILAASAGLALAAMPAMHTLTVKMPDGGTADIQYAGDVAPKVSFKDSPAANPFPAGAAFLDDPAFADMQRLSAAMDKQMNDAMSQMTAPGAMMKTGGMDADGNLPAGVTWSSLSNQPHGGTFCARSVEMTQGPGDKAPKIVTKTEGQCQAPQNNAQSPSAAPDASSPRQSL